MATLKCPKCKSHNIQVMDGRKKLSITKGVIGGALLGPLGAVAGGVGLGKKGVHVKRVRNIGNTSFAEEYETAFNKALKKWIT